MADEEDVWREHIMAMFTGAHAVLDGKHTVHETMEAIVSQLVDIGVEPRSALVLVRGLENTRVQMAMDPSLYLSFPYAAFLMGLKIGANPTPLYVP